MSKEELAKLALQSPAFMNWLLNNGLTKKEQPMSERCEWCGEGKDPMTETDTSWQCNDCEQWNSDQHVFDPARTDTATPRPMPGANQ